VAKNNIAKLKRLINEEDLVVIQPSSNMLYLIDFIEEVMERPILLFITRHEEFLLIPKMYEEQFSTLNIPLITYLDGEDPYEKINIKPNYFRLLVDENIHAKFLLKLIERIKPTSIDTIAEIMRNLRMYKDDEEILRIKHAVSLSEKVFEEFIKRVREGMSEKQLSFELKKVMMEFGVEPSFEPIITSGENTTMPHLRSTDKKVRKGDIVIIDYGVRYKGYCSDITRVLSLGKPQKEVLEIFEIVRDSKNLVEEGLRNGIKGFEADKIARDYIASKGFGENFIHRTGHGIGIDVHEPPYLSPDYNQALEDRMVFTVEPGIYIQGKFGVRLEDMVVLQGKGIVLNKKQEEIFMV